MNPYGNKGLPVRLIYLAAALAWWLVSGCGWRYRRKAVVLCYHNVSREQRRRFSRQMKMIAHRVSTIDAPLKRRDTRRPAVCITFDDALAGVKAHGLPALLRHDLPAVIFAVSGCLDRAPMWDMPTGHPDRGEMILSVQDCIELDATSRIRIESHTMTHPDLTSIESGELKEELVNSKAILESMLKRTVDYLALPYGAGDENVDTIARHAGYTKVFTLEPCFHDPEADSHRVGRFSATPNMWPLEFRLTVDGAYAWLCGWRKIVRQWRPYSSSVSGNLPMQEVVS